MTTEFLGMENAFWQDVQPYLAGLASLATNQVCGSEESAGQVRTVVETVVEYRRSTAAMLGAALAAATVTGVAVDAAHTPEVRAAFGNARNTVGSAVGSAAGKVANTAWDIVAGVARRCRGNRGNCGNRVRFAPYGQRDHEVMKDAEQQPVPLEACYLWEEWYAKCAQAIGCQDTEWKREFNLAYMVRDSKWESLDSQQALCYGLQFGLHVNERMDKHTLVCCLIATERLVLLGLAKAWSDSELPQ